MLVDSTPASASSALARRIRSANGPAPSVEPLIAPVTTGTLAIAMVGRQRPATMSASSRAARCPVETASRWG